MLDRFWKKCIINFGSIWGNYVFLMPFLFTSILLLYIYLELVK